MDNEIILESFINENISIANKISRQIDFLKADSSEEEFRSIRDNLKIIKGNSRIMDFTGLEKICHSFEEIIIAIITKNLTFTNNVKAFLSDLTVKLIKHIEAIKYNNAEYSDQVENIVIECDRIAAGMILESNTQKETDTENSKIQDQKNIIISSENLNEMLRNFDEISIQRSRLRHESVTLEKYDSTCGIEFERLRKDMSSTINNLESLLQKVQTQLLEAGMVRLSHTINEFQIKHYAEKCRIEIEETDLMMDKLIAPHLANILNILLQNSLDNEFENIASPCVRIYAKKNGDLIEITYQDNGNGIDYEKLQKEIIFNYPQREKEILEMNEETLSMYLFTSGLSSLKPGLHSAWKEIEKIKGILKINTDTDTGTSFTISFPKSLSSETGFTISHGNNKYFIPSNYVVESVSKSNKELVTDTQKPYFEHRNEKIRIYRLSSILPYDSNESKNSHDTNTILIIRYLELKFGLIVDAVEGFSNKNIKDVPEQLKGIHEVEGIVIDENYDIIPVLNVPSLIKRFTWLRDYDLKRTEVAARRTVKNILVADSSIFARHIIRSLYESNGYFVEEAKDGIEALDVLKKKEISLIISAVEMPRMNGLTLLDNLRRNDEKKNIPVILFPFDATPEEESYYLEAGALSVIRKNNFDRNTLLEITKEGL